MKFQNYKLNILVLCYSSISKISLCESVKSFLIKYLSKWPKLILLNFFFKFFITEI